MNFFTPEALSTVLVAACTTFIITQAHIFGWLREFIGLFRCSLCTGFWVGIFYGLEHWDANAVIPLFDNLQHVFPYGVVGSVASYLLVAIVNFIELR